MCSMQAGQMCLVCHSWHQPRPEFSPVLIELPFDLIAEMLCPYSVECSEASGSGDVANNAHHNHGGCLNDGHSLQQINEVQHTNLTALHFRVGTLNQVYSSS